MRFFYSPGYYHPLPPGHPFPMAKFPQAHEILMRKGTIAPDEIIEIGPATREILERVHTPEYLDKIANASLSPREQTTLGLPPSLALLERSARETEGTRLAARAALEEGIAVNLAGGTHHAFADHGEGFCVLNDVVVTVRDLHRQQPNLRILIADTDAHQGNGTHALLAEDPRVFCYSIHVGRNYPSRKVSGNLDVPLDRYVSGLDFLEALERTLPTATSDFRPDLVIWLSGADPHRNDRFGQMQLTARDMADRDTFVLELFIDIPTALLYGGGYNREPLHTAQLHVQTVTLARRIRG